MSSPVVRELRDFFAKLSIVPATVLVASGVALFVYQYYGGTDFFDNVIAKHTPLSPADKDAASYFYWFGSAFVVLGVIPWMILKAASRLDPPNAVRDTGLGLGDWRFGLVTASLFYGVMLVLLAGVVWMFPDGFLGYYPMYRNATRSITMLLTYEAAYCVYFIAWEYFFRGFMTFGLEKTIGIWSIFVQALPFAVMHFGKPDAEALSSVFGGIALGWLALRTRSIWWGVIVHGLTAVSLDFIVIAVQRA